jgi:pimeloyl-ACP methyl ester carboxylesterase
VIDLRSTLKPDEGTVVLLHGYGETGDMWAPLAADLARDHTVIVPDLRG